MDNITFTAEQVQPVAEQVLAAVYRNANADSITYVAGRVADAIADGEDVVRVREIIWMTFSGGSTAESVAQEIMQQVGELR